MSFLHMKLDPKSPVIGHKDESFDREDDFLDQIKPRVKNIRPNSAKAADSMKHKRPKTAKNVSAIRKTKSRNLADFSILAKLKPRRVNIDKEQLYEENMALKLKNNGLHDQVIKLRTRMTQVEKELTKKEETTENFQLLKPTRLLNSLKSTIKDLKQEVQQKNDEIIKLRRHMKLTKIAEIELEVQAYVDECTRLRHHLEEIMRQKDSPQMSREYSEDKNEQQMFIVNNLRKENEELSKSVILGKEEINKWRERVLDLEKDKKKLNSKRNEASFKTEVKGIKHQYELQIKELNNKEVSYKEEISRQKNINNELDSKVAGYEKCIRDLTTQLELYKKKADAKEMDNEVDLKKNHDKDKEDKKNRDENKRKEEERKKQDEAKAVEQEKKIIEENKRIEEERKRVEEKKKIEENKKRLEEVKKKENDAKFLEDEKKRIEEDKKKKEKLHHEEKNQRLNEKPKLSEDVNPSPTDPKSSQEVPKTSANPRPESAVSRQPLPSPISDLFSHLSLRMQINRISITQLPTTLFPSTAPDKFILPSDLTLSLKKPPLNFSSSEAETLTSHIFETSQKVPQKSIADRLLKLTESWDIFSPEDEATFDEQLNAIISTNKGALKEACKKYDKSNNGIIQAKEFQNVLNALDLKFPSRVVTYMQLLFYSHNMMLRQVPYRHFIKAYGEVNDDDNEDEDEEDEDISDEEKAKVVRHYLAVISKVLVENKKGVRDVFEFDNNGIISANQFIVGLKKMGFAEIEQEHVMMMLEALQYENSEDVCVSIDEFEEILMHYGLQLMNESQVSEESDHSMSHYKKVSLLDSENVESSYGEHAPKSFEAHTSNEAENYDSDYENDFQ